MAIPAHTQAALDRYVERRCRPGSFLRAVIANDLTGAVLLADSENRKALIEITEAVWQQVPPVARGSKTAVDLWCGWLTWPNTDKQPLTAD